MLSPRFPVHVLTVLSRFSPGLLTRTQCLQLIGRTEAVQRQLEVHDARLRGVFIKVNKGVHWDAHRMSPHGPARADRMPRAPAQRLFQWKGLSAAVSVLHSVVCSSPRLHTTHTALVEVEAILVNAASREHVLVCHLCRCLELLRKLFDTWHLHH